MKKNVKIGYTVLILVLFTAIFTYLIVLVRESKIESPYSYEIKENELTPFIVDNPNSTIVVCTDGTSGCDKFNKRMNKIINKYALQEKIVYLNSDSYKNLPVLLMYEDGALKETISLNEKSDKEIISILKEENVIVSE